MGCLSVHLFTDMVLLPIHIQTLFTCLLDIVLYHIHIQTQDLLLLLLVFCACYVSGHVFVVGDVCALYLGVVACTTPE